MRGKIICLYSSFPCNNLVTTPGRQRRFLSILNSGGEPKLQSYLGCRGRPAGALWTPAMEVGTLCTSQASWVSLAPLVSSREVLKALQPTATEMEGKPTRSLVIGSWRSDSFVKVVGLFKYLAVLFVIKYIDCWVRKGRTKPNHPTQFSVAAV